MRRFEACSCKPTPEGPSSIFGTAPRACARVRDTHYWYDFTVRGERYRGSTKETNETRAQKAVALKLAAAVKGSDPLDRKPPTLREYAKDFLDWAERGRLESDSRRYYRNG